MPAVVRLGDMCSGHGAWPPRPNVQGSPNVFVNNIPVHRVTDAWPPHPGPDMHASVQGSGSPNVFSNSLAVARVGDSVACGSTNAQGSGNVFAN